MTDRLSAPMDALARHRAIAGVISFSLFLLIGLTARQGYADVNNCIPNTCVQNTCQSDTCDDGCGPLVNGSLSCTHSPALSPATICTPNNCGADRCPTSPPCDNGCGGKMIGTKDCGSCNNTCAANVCPYATCVNSCGDTIVGTKDCSGCDHSCQTNYCTNQTCVDSCGNVVPGTNSCIAPCNGALNVVCGNVTAGENNAALKGILIQLRNGQTGKVMKTATTANDGTYTITAVNSGSYYVTPSLDRFQSTSPDRLLINVTATSGASANFTVLGVPAIVKVTDTPGTSVLVSQTKYHFNDHPPKVSAIATGSYSNTIDSSGSVTLKVPGGITYYLTCWKRQSDGNYNTVGSIQINDPNTLAPEQQYSVSCPTTKAK